MLGGSLDGRGTSGEKWIHVCVRLVPLLVTETITTLFASMQHSNTE